MFLSSLVISGMIQLDCNLLAQSPKEIANSIGMKLVLIPKGTFMMGSPESEEGRQENESQHEVTISNDYYLGAYEVTQTQYQTVTGNNPSCYQGALVGNQKAGRVYQLPTEAQWEYTCRAGSKTIYSFDDGEGLLPEYGWFKRNSSQRTHTVGLLEPNAWGLYDMHGNVWEWCSDWYGEYPKNAVSDPIGPTMGTDCVNRGGCWLYQAASCRSASRNWAKPSYRDGLLGFRVGLSPSGIPK
jgi:formylglycine-generating enzyme required for sulfatase activity